MNNTITKTTGQIFKENIFTLFNLLNFVIAGLLFAVHAYSNMLFIVIILTNITVGIVQEYKAKKLVDSLSILNRPRVTIMRDGKGVSVSAETVKKGDVLVLDSGCQVSNDAVVISGEAELDESLLTGESDGVVKTVGSHVMSGSFIISGKCLARVTHTGSDNYATRLTDEVRQHKKMESELLGSMRRVTGFTSRLIVPLGLLLFLEAYVLRGMNVTDSVVASSAALLGMLPKGLVLLISVSLANGVINLSRKKILVQNMYSLEALALSDTLCLDKTGTLTTGKMRVCEVCFVGEHHIQEAKAKELLRAYLGQSEDNNATMQALREYFPKQAGYEAVLRIPFSSKRKWGAVCLEPIGTVVVGAPEKIMGAGDWRVEKMLFGGRRVIAVGLYRGRPKNDAELLAGVEPMLLIALADEIRKDAEKTLSFFEGQGVDVKVISGDHVRTVSETAKRAGLGSWQRAVDMSEAGDFPDYDMLCEKYSVFARVTPQQKKELVLALRRRGHRTAMMGDGVNDLLAMHEADCSIAVAEGSDASRQLAHIVLLESDFTHLPQVVLEGRRVLNNVTRTSGVFFIKTIYSVLLTIFCLIINMPFPFIPIQITLIDAAMEAWPSFLTILESYTGRVKRGFLKNALLYAAPFALVIMSEIMFVRLFTGLSGNQAFTVMYFLLILTTMTAVIRSCMPFNRLRVFICAAMALGTLFTLIVFPSLLGLSSVTVQMLCVTAAVFAFGLVILAVISYASRGFCVKDR